MSLSYPILSYSTHISFPPKLFAPSCPHQQSPQPPLHLCLRRFPMVLPPPTTTMPLLSPFIRTPREPRVAAPSPHAPAHSYAIPNASALPTYSPPSHYYPMYPLPSQALPPTSLSQPLTTTTPAPLIPYPSPASSFTPSILAPLTPPTNTPASPGACSAYPDQPSTLPLTLVLNLKFLQPPLASPSPPTPPPSPPPSLAGPSPLPLHLLTFQ